MLQTAPLPRPPRSHRRPPRRRRALLIVLVVAALLLTPVGVSYTRALSAPGSATLAVRTVEWLRDHGVGPVVDIVENWVYAHNQATAAAPDPSALPQVDGATTDGGPQPDALPLPGGGQLPGEARWSATAAAVGGVHPLYTAYFRPDPATPSLVAGVAWMNQSLVRAHLFAGTVDPVPPGSDPPADTAGGQVPTDLRANLLATFNSGFKLKDSRGGYVVDGREIVPPVDGAATAAIDRAGHISIGQWGRDLGPRPDLVAVRQSLALIVDDGAPVPGLGDNMNDAWGTAHNQLQYTWRSGLGLDRRGDLVYLAADHLSLAELAIAMGSAGVVRGMQLDIHPPTVGFFSYGPGAAQQAGAHGTRLLPAMRPADTRYLQPDQRDFFAITTVGANPP